MLAGLPPLMSIVKSLVAGGVAGGVSRTAVAPLERLKILQQVGQGADAAKYRGLWNGLRCMAQTEGFRGMFKGNGTNCVRIVPNSAVKFLTYETLSKEWIRQRRRVMQQPGMCSVSLACLPQLLRAPNDPSGRMMDLAARTTRAVQRH